MASYKQACLHCGSYIEPDSLYCPYCKRKDPFGYHCPTCHYPIEKGQSVCSGCGRALYISCPACSKQTFVQDKCEECNTSLMIRCANPRCGAEQFFENIKCTACGKKIKTKK
ncbi:MAG: zinc ribbon domain-containing protein [Peptococcia bacterium]